MLSAESGPGGKKRAQSAPEPRASRDQLPALSRLPNVLAAARGAAAGILCSPSGARRKHETAMSYDRKRYSEDPAYREKALAASRAHYKANSERINEGRRRRYANDPAYRSKVLADNRKTSRAHRLRRAYGISLQHYDRMFARQRGMCLICWKTFDRSLCVDHSGDTGMVRALLCTNCNVGFGNFFENPAFLRRAADYGEFFTAHVQGILRGDPAALREAARLRTALLDIDLSSLLPPQRRAGGAAGARAKPPPRPPAASGVAPVKTVRPAKPAAKKNAPGSTKRRRQRRPRDTARGPVGDAPAIRGGRNPSRRQAARGRAR